MKAQSGVAMEERMSILPAASGVCGGVPSSRDWAGVWKERACEEEEGKEELVKGSVACDFIELIVSPTPMILKLL